MTDPAPPPVPIHEHALSNLRYIREAMERASSFTSIPGWGGFVVGLTAVGATAIAHQRLAIAPREWMLVWLIEALVAAPIALVAMIRKGRQVNASFTNTAARRFFVSYFAPLIAGAVLTIALHQARAHAILPTVWLLLYGTSFVSSGAFSIPVVPVMGFTFMLLGIAAAFVSLPAGNVLMGLGFGGIHLIFGFIIARNYGG